MWRLAALSVLCLSLASGCSGGAGETPEPEHGAGSPVEAVNRLVAAVNKPDFDSAAAIAMPDHSALASLSEGASFGEVADAIVGGDQAVASNFWSGFAQGVGDLLTGAVSTVLDGTTNQDGVEFDRVAVKTSDGATRYMFTREEHGHRIDLFASFGAGLAARMTQPVDRLLATDTEDARVILDSLKTVVPSLLVAAGQEGLPPESVLEILGLVELITRVH